jgi:hypothetical protein
VTVVLQVVGVELMKLLHGSVGGLLEKSTTTAHMFVLVVHGAVAMLSVLVFGLFIEICWSLACFGFLCDDLAGCSDHCYEWCAVHVFERKQCSLNSVHGMMYALAAA